MKNKSGFTQMELMIVVAIIGIISAVAVPNMISWRANYQLHGTARELMALINDARLAAIKNNSTVTVTYIPATRTVQYTYTNRATGVAGPVTTIVFKPGVTVTASTFAGNGFRFNSRGLPINLADNNFAAGTVSLTNARGTILRVIMASTGSTRIDRV